MIYQCTRCPWKGPAEDLDELELCDYGFQPSCCPECGFPVFSPDLEERIAIRVEGGQDEEEATDKATQELNRWWEDVAT